MQTETQLFRGKSIDPSMVFDCHLGWGASTAKFTVKCMGSWPNLNNCRKKSSFKESETNRALQV